MVKHSYNESDLNLNLNELIIEIMRELFVASKKVSIYSSKHPLAQKAINRVYILLDRVFKYKRYFNTYVSSGQLYALNIKMRRSNFNDQIMEYMQLLELDSVLIRSDISVYEFSLFLDRLVKRLPMSDHRNYMVNYLAHNKIDSVKINSEQAERIHKYGIRLHGDIPDDFSVRNIVTQLIGDDFGFLSYMINGDVTDEEYVAKYNHDYYHELVNFLIPEIVSTIPSDRMITIASGKIANAFSGIGSLIEVEQEQISEIKGLIAGLNYHADKQTILEEVGREIARCGIPKDIYTEILPQTSSLKIESSEKIDEFIYGAFNNAVPGYNLSEFKELYGRILRTGQQSKAKSVINIMLNHLAGPDLDLRKNSFILFRYLNELYSGATDLYLIDHLVSKVSEYLNEQKETFEFADLIWEVMRNLIFRRDYSSAAKLCELICSRRKMTDGIWAYNSVAVKKAVEDMNRQEVINWLITDLTDSEYRPAHAEIKKILTTIGSEEVAAELASIISHDNRLVRQSTLKILADLGKASLRVYSAMMANDLLFERDQNKRELPSDKWYVARNVIFVLGSLKDAEACKALRIRMNDPDTRIRREIIQSLEKIGDDRAVDLLIIMSDDDDYEIREAAVIAISFSGSAEIVPEIVNIAERRIENVISNICTIGKLGGIHAREFLDKLLSDKEYLVQFASSRVSKESIKLAAIKALGKIGDDESIGKIKKFNDSMTASQKIFFGSKLKKTANDILKDNQT